MSTVPATVQLTVIAAAILSVIETQSSFLGMTFL